MTRLLSLGGVTLVAMTAIATNATPTSAAFLTIDNFTTPSGTLVFQPSNPTATKALPGNTQSNVATGSGIIGGVREQTFTVNGNKNVVPTKVGNASSTIDGSSTILDVGNSPRVDTTVKLVYDGKSGPGGSLNANLVNIGGQPVGTEFQVAVSSLDLSLGVTVKVTDNLGHTGTVTHSAVGPINGPPDTLLVFNFSDAGYTGVDFTNVKSLEFDFSSANTAADYQISILGVYGNAVPEPASLGLAAAGVVAVGGFARRKFAKKA